MSKSIGITAYLLGLLAVAWVAAGYVGVSSLALAMTLLIAAVYLAAGTELLRFHRATAGLQAAIDGTTAPVADLTRWLAPLHPSLQTPVRLRIEGGHSALPGPAMAPYLVGLLVLLGMLGTFLGMVVTLKGAVIALESSTDVATIRAALAAPVQGLGVAFGTSVAGVAASAMLGLVAALCRRDRLRASRQLDSLAATRLREHSFTHQQTLQRDRHREAVLSALEKQAEVLPQVLAQMQASMAALADQQQVLGDRLLAGQAGFHTEAQAAYTRLADSVGRSLQTSLADSARAASAVLQPVVEATLAGLAAQGARAEQQLAAQVQAHLDGVGHQSAQLLTQLGQSQAAWQAEAEQRDARRLATWAEGLDRLALALQRGWTEATAEAQAGQLRICEALEGSGRALQTQAEAQARATQAELARLIDTASEAPRAAAALVAQLREQLTESLVRDNALLDERARVMATVGHLLDTVNRAATDQRSAIDALVSGSAEVLQQVGRQFGERLEADAGRLAEAAVQVTGSAVEVASLGEAFGTAVQLFSRSSEAMTLQLQRIESALAQSAARSDEQLGYYVAQARELIDLSISSQRQIVDDLQRIAERPLPVAGATA